MERLRIETLRKLQNPSRSDYDVYVGHSTTQNAQNAGVEFGSKILILSYKKELY